MIYYCNSTNCYKTCQIFGFGFHFLVFDKKTFIVSSALACVSRLRQASWISLQHCFERENLNPKLLMFFWHGITWIVCCMFLQMSRIIASANDIWRTKLNRISTKNYNIFVIITCWYLWQKTIILRLLKAYSPRNLVVKVKNRVTPSLNISF